MYSRKEIVEKAIKRFQNHYNCYGDYPYLFMCNILESIIWENHIEGIFIEELFPELFNMSYTTTRSGLVWTSATINGEIIDLDKEHNKSRITVLKYLYTLL